MGLKHFQIRACENLKEKLASKLLCRKSKSDDALNAYIQCKNFSVNGSCSSKPTVGIS
jgi:hypothetical protein